MKKITLLRRLTASCVVAVMAVCSAYAAPISKEEARQMAADFMQKRNGAEVCAEPETVYGDTREDGTQGMYYVFNTKNDKGWVIIAGDNAMTKRILGFNLSGHFNAVEIPENVSYWTKSLADVKKRLEETPISNPFEAPAKVVSSTRPTSIAPLVSVTWGQRAPYNKYCPVHDGADSPAGCVALGMGMMMSQHKYPTELPFRIPDYSVAGTGAWSSYTHTYPAVPAGTKIDWENMLDSYATGTTYNSAQEEAIANFLLYCGQAVKMRYGPNGSSGTTTTPYLGLALTYFGYPALCIGVGPSTSATIGFLSQSEKEDLFYWDLKNGRSFIFYGTTETAATTDVAHCFIGDGYDAETGLFHINWGWNGSYNGYFELAELNTGMLDNGVERKYNKAQGAILGLTPKTGTPGLRAKNIEVESTGKLRMTFENITGYDKFCFYYGLGRVDEETGEIVALYPQKLSEVIVNGGTIDYEVDLQTVFNNTGNKLTEGTYKFVPSGRIVLVNGSKVRPIVACAPAIPLENAYIEVVKTSSGITARMVGNPEVTGIKQVATTTTVNDDVIYNLQGQRVKEPVTRGIYIKNGKKVIIGQ